MLALQVQHLALPHATARVQITVSTIVLHLHQAVLLQMAAVTVEAKRALMERQSMIS